MSYTIVIQSKKPHLLRKCLDTIKSNLNPEIVFVLDNETDFDTKCNFETKKILIDFDRVSSGGGMNLGFKLAKHEYMVFTQDDITFEPYILDKLYEEYIKNDFVILSPNIQESSANMEIKPGIQTIKKENYIGRIFACFMISKNYYTYIGDIDEQFHPVYFEDMDYFHRMELLDLFRVGCVNSLVCKHQGKGTITDFNIGQNSDKYVKKWGKIHNADR